MPRGKDRREAVFAAVSRGLAGGRCPSIREICRETGISSPSSVWRELRALEEEGRIVTEKNGARGISVMYRDGTVCAAVPFITRMDPVTGAVNLCEPEEFLPFILPKTDISQTFAFRVRADGDEARRGDIAVFSRIGAPASGTAAVFVLNGVPAPGRIVEKPDGTYAFTEGREIKLGGEMDIAAAGRLLGIVRRFF